jgi:hypothetical protein
MNEALLKFFTVALIGLVVASALWLAYSVQTSYRANAQRFAMLAALERSGHAPVPVAVAASASLLNPAIITPQ